MELPKKLETLLDLAKDTETHLIHLSDCGQDTVIHTPLFGIKLEDYGFGIAIESVEITDVEQFKKAISDGKLEPSRLSLFVHLREYPSDAACHVYYDQKGDKILFQDMGGPDYCEECGVKDCLFIELYNRSLAEEE